MIGLKAVGGLVSGILKPASDAYGKHVDRKSANEGAKSKLRQAKVDGKKELALSRLEIEMLSKRMEGGTWRDEYVTVIGTMPLILIFGASIADAFGAPQVMVGVNNALTTLHEMGVPLGDIMLWTILAGLGIRTLKRP